MLLAFLLRLSQHHAAAHQPRIVKLVITIMALALLTSNFAAASTLIVSIMPETPAISVGDTFKVDINVSNFSDLQDYQFSLDFDASALTANTITEGPLFGSTLDSYFVAGMIDNTSGAISLTADALFGSGASVSSPGTIAVVEFTALTTGTSAITFSPQSDLIFLDSQANILDVTAEAGDITVGPAAVVPEPSSLWIPVMAVIVICCARRRLPSKLWALRRHPQSF
jgi:hypothetical protein